MITILSIFGILAFFLTDVFSQHATPCTTWNDLNGMCIETQQCSMPLLKETQDQCGKKANTTLVCCPNNDILQKIDKSPLLPNTRECGRSFNNNNDGSVTKMEFPWAALIEYTDNDNKTSLNCGATLINNRYVLTAAQCILSHENSRITGIRLGEWDLSTNPDCLTSPTGVTGCGDPRLDVGIEEIIVHRNYSALNYRNDIALIRLDRYVEYTDFISPVCLPLRPKMLFNNVKLQVVGWDSSRNSTETNKKQIASLPLWSFIKCIQKYNTKKIHLGGNEICAGGDEGVGVCEGDSGGSLVVQETWHNRNVYVLAGITSFVQKPCALAGWPGVFTEVDKYIDWILDALRP